MRTENICGYKLTFGVAAAAAAAVLDVLRLLLLLSGCQF
jgi:hypothetical protein